jgi:adenosylhomocysteine nucleosidase
MSLPHGRRAHVAALALVAVIVAGAVLAATTIDRSPGPARAASAQAPIGIVSAIGPEQAAILSIMRVIGTVTLDGYRYYSGTIDGHPVVDVAGAELDESAELATYLLDTRFHPRATLFSGTAGAQNNELHVGDVVLSGFVIDKSNVHYYLGGYQELYGNQEVPTTKRSDLRGAVISGHGTTLPTPADAAKYGEGPSSTAKDLPDVAAFAAPHQLITLGQQATLGTTEISDATGDAKRKGTIADHAIAGVIGQAPVWTEPLSVTAAQNMLYQNDTEENEGTGFAFANAQLGVPWLLVRGISDSVWYPNAYDGGLASRHAARVVRSIVDHAPATIEKAPETLSQLSPQSNASRAGYLIAAKAYYRTSPVSRVVIAGPDGLGGKARTLSAKRLATLKSEYTYAAGRIR